MSESLNLKIRNRIQFDGSAWREYQTRNHVFILTGLGRLLVGSKKLHKTLDAYIKDYEHERIWPEDTRSFLAAGQHARVFSLGVEDLVIKESKPFNDLSKKDSLLPSLLRMDRLFSAVQKNCPRWIDVPSHYGVMIDKSDTSKQFMLMQKIDHGVTVGDVVNYEDQFTRATEGELEASAMCKFGKISPEIAQEVATRYEQLQGLVRQALNEEGLSPEKYLSDIERNPYNVVLERLDTPIDDSHIRYWVIDQ